MCTNLNDTFFKPRIHKGLSAAEYLEYLLAKLDATLAMFDGLGRLPFSSDQRLSKVIERERNDAVSHLIRLQYVLGWSKVRTLYKEPGSHAKVDLDHVVPLSKMTQLVINANPADRHAMFVRAWLAPVAVISSKSHAALSYKNGTSDLMSGNPFNRYTLNHIYVEACGAALPSNFTIKDHYLCIAGNPLIRGILTKYRILP